METKLNVEETRLTLDQDVATLKKVKPIFDNIDDALSLINPIFVEYHRMHAAYAAEYARVLNQKLGFIVPDIEITFAARMHDIFKGIDKCNKINLNEFDFEHSVMKGIGSYKVGDTHVIDIDDDTRVGFSSIMELNELSKYDDPCNGYVRTNLDVLAEFNLEGYYNSDASNHALAAGIFLYKMGIQNKNIIYPVLFHSCPIYKVYKFLPIETRLAIDIVVLADKLSSNYIKMNDGREVPIDLDAAVFGLSGTEFNFRTGVLLAKILGNSDKPGVDETKITNYYKSIAGLSNPLINLMNGNPLMRPSDLGGEKVWRQRESRVLVNH